jgi:hypothetical protein
MGEVSADAGTPFGSVHRGRERIAHPVFVSHLAKDPASDRFDLWIARGTSFYDRGGQFQHLVGLAVAARQKIMNHIVGKILYQREMCVGFRGDLIRRIDGAGTSNYRPALPQHGSLLKVSEGIVKLIQLHWRLDREVTLFHFLSKTALRSQHEDNSGFIGRVHRHCASSFKNHIQIGSNPVHSNSGAASGNPLSCVLL